MNQIFHSNLAIVDFVKKSLEQSKTVRDGIRRVFWGFTLIDRLLSFCKNFRFLTFWGHFEAIGALSG